MDIPKILGGDFTTLPSVIRRTNRQNMQKAHRRSEQHYQSHGTYWYLQNPTATHGRTNILLSTQGTCSMIDNILGHGPNLRELQMIEILQSIFSEHKEIK